MTVDDDELLMLIKDALASGDLFHTSGTKKVHHYLRRVKGIRVCRERVNRVMRHAGLLSPQRSAQPKRQHKGTIIPDTINRRGGTDATMLSTATGERLWLFAVIDHYSGEILGWHIVPVGQGTRRAALEPVKQAVLLQDAADGVAAWFNVVLVFQAAGREMRALPQFDDLPLNLKGRLVGAMIGGARQIIQAGLAIVVEAADPLADGVARRAEVAGGVADAVQAGVQDDVEAETALRNRIFLRTASPRVPQ